MAVQPAEQGLHYPSDHTLKKPQTAEIVPFRHHSPDPLNLPAIEGVVEVVYLRTNNGIGSFAYATFDRNSDVEPAFSELASRVKGEGRKVLRGVMDGDRIAASLDLKHPLALANLLRKKELSATPRAQSSAVAFEIRAQGPGGKLEIRFSNGNRPHDLRGKEQKKHNDAVKRLKRFLADNLPLNSWEEGEEPLHVMI